MSWVIDGNNLLGRAGASRDAADTKRQLVRSLANFARAKRTKVACYFDGTERPHRSQMDENRSPNELLHAAQHPLSYAVCRS